MMQNELMESVHLSSSHCFLAEHKSLRVTLNAVPPLLFLCHRCLERMLSSPLPVSFVGMWLLISAVNIPRNFYLNIQQEPLICFWEFPFSYETVAILLLLVMENQLEEGR